MSRGKDCRGRGKGMIRREEWEERNQRDEQEGRMGREEERDE